MFRTTSLLKGLNGLEPGSILGKGVKGRVAMKNLPWIQTMATLPTSILPPKKEFHSTPPALLRKRRHDNGNPRILITGMSMHVNHFNALLIFIVL